MSEELESDSTHGSDSASRPKPAAIHKGRVLLLTVLFMSSFVLVNVFFSIENWQRDLTVNHAKLEEVSDDPTLRPLVLQRNLSEAAASIIEFANQSNLWKFESSELIDETVRLHLTRKTQILRFTDDIHVRLFPIKEGTRVEAESRSRIGKGDLGQNPRNLRELVGALSTDLQTD